MADPLENTSKTAITNGTFGRIIPPSANDLDPIAKSIVTLAAGDVTILPVGNADIDTLSFVGVPAGWTAPFRVRRVTAATVAVATVEG